MCESFQSAAPLSSRHQNHYDLPLAFSHCRDHAGLQPQNSDDNPLEPKAAAPPVAPGLLRSSSVVGSMTMLSRVLGLLRDMVFARVIGADALADAFFVAFKIPNFFRRLFAEGAFAQAFVPVLGEYREKGTPAAVKALLDSVAGVLGSSLIVLTILVVIASPLVTALFAFGFWLDYPDKFDAASSMLRITFPYFKGCLLLCYLSNIPKLHLQD